jgi:hypothetical protein
MNDAPFVKSPARAQHPTRRSATRAYVALRSVARLCIAVDGAGRGGKLREMKLFRPTPVLIFSAAIIAATACDRSKAPPPVDSAAIKPAAVPESVAVAQSRSWNPSAGPLLLVAGETPDHAIIVAPDSATASAAVANIPHLASVTLFGRGGSVQTAELQGIGEPSACIVASLNAAPPPRPWSVGFIGGVVAPLATDSVESIPRADSIVAVTWLNRLASALPNDSAGRFSGLPFVVRSMWRFTAPGGPQIVVGTLARSINQEATPLQESTFLIAERAPSDSTLKTVYSERSYGNEETVQTRDLLAGALIGANRNAAVIIVRDYGDATAYALIERGDDGKWRARWTSARRHCAPA